MFILFFNYTNLYIYRIIILYRISFLLSDLSQPTPLIIITIINLILFIRSLLFTGSPLLQLTPYRCLFVPRGAIHPQPFLRNSDQSKTLTRWFNAASWSTPKSNQVKQGWERQLDHRSGQDSCCIWSAPSWHLWHCIFASWLCAIHSLVHQKGHGRVFHPWTERGTCTAPQLLRQRPCIKLIHQSQVWWKQPHCHIQGRSVNFTRLIWPQRETPNSLFVIIY